MVLQKFPRMFVENLRLNLIMSFLASHKPDFAGMFLIL
jgi:hypothetical protein